MPTVAEFIRGEAKGSLDGFVYYPQKCREVFDYYDKDHNQHLDAVEIFQFASVSEFVMVHLSHFQNCWVCCAEIVEHFFPRRTGTF